MATSTSSDKIIDCNDLTSPNCSMNVNAIIGSKQSWTTKPKDFLVDVVWWALFFIGIFISFTLVVSWLLFVLAWWDEKQAEKWKMWIKYSLIWLFLVLASYFIIRLVQFIARW